MRNVARLAVLLAAFAPGVSAQQRAEPGPVVPSAGAVFAVPSPTFETPKDIDYKVAWEIVTPAAQPDRVNQSMNTVARFLNMHAQAGVPRERTRVAMVVHGNAAFELLDDSAYRERHGVDNPNGAMIREILDAGGRVVLCGQSAASRDVPTDRLIPGVQVALSAMTAFVVLQGEGYRVNPG
jgi:intracellular sulfur oxidation DsrE/DsrF family protein